MAVDKDHFGIVVENTVLQPAPGFDAQVALRLEEVQLTQLPNRLEPHLAVCLCVCVCVCVRACVRVRAYNGWLKQGNDAVQVNIIARH